MTRRMAGRYRVVGVVLMLGGGAHLVDSLATILAAAVFATGLVLVAFGITGGDQR